MDGFAILRVRLTPNGGRNALGAYQAGVLNARVASAPVDGAANKALITMVAKELDVAKSRITLHSGETSRDKAVRIEGVTAVELETLVQRAIAASDRSG